MKWSSATDLRNRRQLTDDCVPRIKILVLGDDTRSFLAIVRALGRRGMEVHAAPGDFSGPARHSRYIARLHEIPPWMGDGSDWLAAMQALLARETFDVVIPCNETTLLPLCRHRATLSAFAVLAIPNERAVDVLFDKHSTRELARELGIPVSPGRLSHPADTAEALIAELGAPVVVKPRRSYRLEQMSRRGKVRFAADAAELSHLLDALEPGSHLFERFMPGHGVGVSVLAHRGRVLQSFEHRRVRETPAGSYYRVSAKPCPQRLAAVAAMVDRLAYTGLAMFEFRVRDDGQGWILLEVNARPWGSLPLAVACGVDFPGAWVRLLTTGIEEPAFDYQPGIYGRNLLSDLRHMLTDAAQAAGSPSRMLRLLTSAAGEWRRLLTGRERQDALVLDDPWPGLLELARATRSIARRLLAHAPGRQLAARVSARLTLRAAVRAPGGTITFVCDGNICRSPFAALALRRLLRGAPAGCRVNSAGMTRNPGRPPPELALQAAAEAGFDMSHHRSCHLTRPMAEAAAALVVFEAANRHAILARYPDLRTPILLLGDLARANTGSGPIADPVDGDSAIFAATYRQIEQALGGLATALRRPASAQPTPAVRLLPGRPGHSTR